MHGIGTLVGFLVVIITVLIDDNSILRFSPFKALRKAKEKERETLERQQRSDARGKKKQEKAGMARIMMNTLRNKAENSTSKIKSVHEEKISGITDERFAKTEIKQSDYKIEKSRILISTELNATIMIISESSYKPKFYIYENN